MQRPILALSAAAAILAATAAPGFDRSSVEQVTPNSGEMFVPMPTTEARGIDTIDDRLTFEPWQLIDEMFLRDDVVFLMRHGPTDWSVRDPKTVDPGDCDRQRVLSPQGRRDMFNMGALMAHNGILPGRIVTSEWCRNRQTVEHLLAGAEAIAPGTRADIPVETDPALNLLLHLDGAATVGDMRARIAEWDGGDGSGPLLMVSHYTNIEELTEFRVYEGEILVIDPDRGNRVLGYLRLRSAAPDVGHFDVE